MTPVWPLMGRSVAASARGLAVAAVISGVSALALAQPASPLRPGDAVTMQSKVPAKVGEFRYTSFGSHSGIACAMPPRPGAAEPVGLDYSYCLRLGPLSIGMEWARVQPMLAELGMTAERTGMPPRVVERPPGGGATVLFPVTTGRSGDTVRLASYLLVGVDAAGLVQMLQLTGWPGGASGSLPFSSITLGTARNQVRDVLGNPSAHTDVPQIGGRNWNYAPFPFSVEFVDRTVYSIRIERPKEADRGKVFDPLPSAPD